LSTGFSGGSLIPALAHSGQQLALVEHDRVSQGAHLVQRIAVLAFDDTEPMFEEVVQEEIAR
jgi:hypothetical protein